VRASFGLPGTPHKQLTLYAMRVILLARIIEVRSGNDYGYADRFLNAIIRQGKPRDKAIAVKLAADVDAWRRARRAYRNFFE
jgi:hypothetical protein